jgi:hypothetical protein
MDASLQQSPCPLPDEKSKPNRSRRDCPTMPAWVHSPSDRSVRARVLGCPPLVPVVQAADLPYGDHASVLRRVHRPRFGRVLGQGEVSSDLKVAEAAAANT